MNPITILKLIVRGDTAAARKALGDLGTQARGVASRMNAGFSSVKDSLFSLRGAFAALGVGALFRSIVRETTEAERASAQLDAVLKSTGGAAGLTRDEITSMASALQKVTTFGDDAIIGMQNLLLTFTNIRKEGGVFERTTEAVLNMSTALGQDLKESAIQVGKALQDPILGVTALRRVGVNLTEQQQALVKQLVESGDAMSAQALILDELDVEFSRTARAARVTFGGALSALGNAFGDLLEGKGGGLVSAREETEKLIDKLDDPETVAAFDTLTTGVLVAAGKLAAAAVEFANFGKDIGFLVASAVGNVTEIDRLEHDLDRVNRSLDKGIGTFLTRFDLFIKPREELEAMREELERALRTAKEAQHFAITGQRLPPEQPSGDEAKPDESAAAPRRDVALIDEEAAKAAEQRAEAIQKLIEGLREEAETTGFTAGKIALYRLEQLGASDAELERARGLVGAAEAQQLFADASKELLEIQEQQRREAEQHAQALEQFAESVKQSVDPTRALRQELERLNEVHAAGLITADEFAERQRQLQEEIEAAGKKTSELSVYADQAARNMQSAFADFLFDPFEDGVKGMADAFVEALKRMAAEAAAAKIFDAIRGAADGEGSDGDGGFFKDLFGGIFGKGDGDASGGDGSARGGGFGEFFKTIFASVFHDGGIAGDVAVMRQIPIAMMYGVPKFHSGGDALGLSSDEVPAILQRGERVLTVEETRAMDRGGLGRSLNMTVVTPSPERFSQSASQIGAATATLLARAKNRNG
jgi:hypothetical protein